MNILLDRAQVLQHNLKGSLINPAESSCMLVCKKSLEKILGGEEGLTIRLVDEDKRYFADPGLLHRLMPYGDIKTEYGHLFQIESSPLFKGVDFTRSLDTYELVEGGNTLLQEAQLLTTVRLVDSVRNQVRIILLGQDDVGSSFPIYSGTSSLGSWGDYEAQEDIEMIQRNIVSVPERIWGYPVNTTDREVIAPHCGYFLYYENYPVAEFSDRGVFIHHDLFSDFDENSFEIYRRILDFVHIMLTTNDPDATYVECMSETSKQRWGVALEGHIQGEIQTTEGEIQKIRREIAVLEQKLKEKYRKIRIKEEKNRSLQNRLQARLEEFEEEFEKIKNMDRVQNILVFHDHFEIDTTSIVMTDISTQEQYEMGTYTICIDFMEGNTRFDSHRVRYGHMGEDMHHPHINRSICYGDFKNSKDLDMYAIRGEYFYAVLYAIQFLEACNPNSCLNGLDEWEPFKIEHA